MSALCWGSKAPRVANADAERLPNELRRIKQLCSLAPSMEEALQDVLFTAITIAFFLLSLAYVRFCDRVR